MRKIFFVLSLIVLSVGADDPPCQLTINTLSCSYNPNVDNCYYTVDMSCDGRSNNNCTQCYVIHLWRQDINGNWGIVYARCFDTPLNCGENFHIFSGVAPLYGMGRYWFQVDIWNGSCGNFINLVDSTFTEFRRN